MSLPPQQTVRAAVPYYRSRYTLAEPWNNREGLAINTLTGAVDVLSSVKLRFIQEHPGFLGTEDDPFCAFLLDRGYYVDLSEAEAAVARQIAREALENARQNMMAKYVLSLTLRCNLSCHYCWQVLEHGNSRQSSRVMSVPMIDACFDYIEDDLRKSGKDTAWVSLFGGEPLIEHPAHRQALTHAMRKTRERGYHLHIASNGSRLHDFRDELIRFGASLQVTVDGADLSGGQPVLLRAGRPLPRLYETLADLAQNGESTIYLRFLAQEHTATAFAGLARHIFADSRFAKNFVLAVAPIQNKTTYEDPDVSPKADVLAALLEHLKDEPYSHLIAYTDWRSLNLFSELRQGRPFLPTPVFYHCEANVNLTCLDHQGQVSACYEGVGNSAFAAGSYMPAPTRDHSQTKPNPAQPHQDLAVFGEYRGRTALRMEECAECALSPICGGGCQVRGFKKTGSYRVPFCDGLPAETRQTLRRWRDFQKLLVPPNHEQQI